MKEIIRILKADFVQVLMIYLHNRSKTPQQLLEKRKSRKSPKQSNKPTKQINTKLKKKIHKSSSKRKEKKKKKLCTLSVLYV
jgi:hypothetical protein